MIKKLQYKFVVITMSIVTVMLCVIMGLIYYFTKINLETASISMMQDLANHPFQIRMPNSSSEDIHLPFFTLQIGNYGELIATGGGYYDLSDESFLIDLISQTLPSSSSVDIIDEYHLRFYKTFSPWGQTIVFSDISSELATLGNLVKSCVFIGLISFFIFLALSFWLAHWAVAPVDRAWRQQRQFVADASHELKTPLTVIMANAELLQNSGSTQEERAKYTSGILVMSVQMRRLVEQMLELARADTLPKKCGFSTVNFSEVTADAVLPFEPVFFEKGLKLETELSENIMVGGDGAQLRQVVDILLDNAQKYSRENGNTRVSLKRAGRHRLLLSVANEGEEIPQADLNNLFKRFFRTDKAHSRTGSFGLGLSIAEAIVTQHRGKIWAESKDGINTFFVELRCN